jgi:hypothetical protein
MDDLQQAMIDRIRELVPQKMAEEIVSVQPMPNIDFEALAEHPLWQSFCQRHKEKNLSDGGVLVSTQEAI